MRPSALSSALYTNLVLITGGALFTYTTNTNYTANTGGRSCSAASTATMAMANDLSATNTDYQVVVTNNSGCNSPLASILTVKVNPKPLQLPVSNGEPTTFSKSGGVTLAAFSLPIANPQL